MAFSLFIEALYLDISVEQNDILRHIYSNQIHLGIWMFPGIVSTHCLAYRKYLEIIRNISPRTYPVHWQKSNFFLISSIPWKSKTGLWFIGHQHFLKYYLGSESLMTRSLWVFKMPSIDKPLWIYHTLPWPLLYSILRVGKSRLWLMVILSPQCINQGCVHKSSLSIHSFLSLGPRQGER